MPVVIVFLGIYDHDCINVKRITNGKLTTPKSQVRF